MGDAFKIFVSKEKTETQFDGAFYLFSNWDWDWDWDWGNLNLNINVYRKK